MHEVFHFKSRAPHRVIGTDEVIDLGGVTVEVVHTPGHTPGHMALLFRKLKVRFGHDDLTFFGPWYGDANSDIDEVLASMEKLRTIPARTWLTSHGDGAFQRSWRIVGHVRRRDSPSGSTAPGSADPA